MNVGNMLDSPEMSLVPKMEVSKKTYGQAVWISLVALGKPTPQNRHL